jgi:hypothetical protein
MLCVAGPCLAAQQGGDSARARLEGRIPPAAIAPVDSIVHAAVSERLPIEPLIRKALEGGAKRVPAETIVLAVRQSANLLRQARAMLLRGGATEPIRPAELEAVAAALGRGLPPPLVEKITAAMPDEPTGPALHAVADLVGHGFAQSSAVGLIVDAGRQGLRGVRLLDVAAAAVREVQRGQTRAQAIANVRRVLPEVPSPAAPTPAAVGRARRP